MRTSGTEWRSISCVTLGKLINLSVPRLLLYKVRTTTAPRSTRGPGTEPGAQGALHAQTRLSGQHGPPGSDPGDPAQMAPPGTRPPGKLPAQNNWASLVFRLGSQSDTERLEPRSLLNGRHARRGKNSPKTAGVSHTVLLEYARSQAGRTEPPGRPLALQSHVHAGLRRPRCWGASPASGEICQPCRSQRSQSPGIEGLRVKVLSPCVPASTQESPQCSAAQLRSCVHLRSLASRHRPLLSLQREPPGASPSCDSLSLGCTHPSAWVLPAPGSPGDFRGAAGWERTFLSSSRCQALCWALDTSVHGGPPSAGE